MDCGWAMTMVQLNVRDGFHKRTELLGAACGHCTGGLAKSPAVDPWSYGVKDQLVEP